MCIPGVEEQDVSWHWLNSDWAVTEIQEKIIVVWLRIQTYENLSLQIAKKDFLKAFINLIPEAVGALWV